MEIETLKSRHNEAMAARSEKIMEFLGDMGGEIKDQLMMIRCGHSEYKLRTDRRQLLDRLKLRGTFGCGKLDRSMACTGFNSFQETTR
jgi:hypothetical protein